MAALTGKVAVVTGASKGIGAAIARALAAAGASVVVNYLSSKAAADRVVGEISSSGGEAIAVPGDVTKAADVKSLFDTTHELFGRLDVLVNNAGIYRFGPVDAFSESDFHDQFNGNVLSVLLATQEALKHLGPDGGSIINIASAAVSVNGPYTSVYTATKSAVVAITRVLGKELAARKIRVNAIAPGGTDTEGARDAGIVGSDLEKQLVASTPLGRRGEPSDIAPIAVFLASDESRWVTGDTIFASGGLR